MDDEKSTALQRAHELIERGELEAAQEVLAPLLERAADDPALWWVYAHAVRDSEIGRAALQRVVTLDPQYPGARELSESLQELDEPPLAAEALTAAEAAQPSAPDINIDDWEDLQPVLEAPAPAQTSRVVAVAVAAALLLIIVGGALIAAGVIDIEQLLAGFSPTMAPAVVLDEPAAESTEADTFSIGTAVPQEEISPVATAGEQAASTEEPTLAAIAEQQESTAEAEPTVAATAEPQSAAADEAPPATGLPPAAPTTDDFAAQSAALAPADTEAPSPSLEATATVAPTATAEPTETSAPTATLEPTATPQPTVRPTFVPLPRDEAQFVEKVVLQLAESDLQPWQASLNDTIVGNTLVLQACAVPGPDFNAKVGVIMNALVALAEDIPSELDAVAAGMLNCGEPEAALRIIGAEVSLIRDYAAGLIDDKAFQREWQQLG